jgi:hypothetical protein
VMNSVRYRFSPHNVKNRRSSAVTVPVISLASAMIR